MPEILKEPNQVLVLVEMTVRVSAMQPGSHDATTAREVGHFTVGGGAMIPPDTWKDAVTESDQLGCVHGMLMRVCGEMPPPVLAKLAELVDGAHTGEGERRIVLAGSPIPNNVLKKVH